MLVGQALAFGAEDEHLRALAVVVPSLPVVVAERELVAVAVKVALADVVKRAVDAALQEREEAFGGVRVDVRRARIRRRRG